MTNQGWSMRPRPAPYYLGFRIFWMILIVAAILGAISVAVKGEEACPPERPFARTVTDYSAPVRCTLLACLGKLQCPTDGDGPCFRIPSNDCGIMAQTAPAVSKKQLCDVKLIALNL